MFLHPAWPHITPRQHRLNIQITEHLSPEDQHTKPTGSSNLQLFTAWLPGFIFYRTKMWPWLCVNSCRFVSVLLCLLLDNELNCITLHNTMTDRQTVMCHWNLTRIDCRGCIWSLLCGVMAYCDSEAMVAPCIPPSIKTLLFSTALFISSR